MGKIFENPNAIYLKNKIINWDDVNTIAFSYYNDKLYVGAIGDIHDEILIPKGYEGDSRGQYSGRLFLKEKIIAFWHFPENKQIFKKVINDLTEKTFIDFDVPGWRVEIPKDFKNLKEYPQGEFNYPDWGSWEPKKDDQEFIDINDYENKKEYTRSREELLQPHPYKPTKRIKGSGSDKTAWDSKRNIKVRQAMYTENKTNDMKNFYPRLNENLTPDSHFGGEIKTNSEDFIWNEVLIWLMEQMETSGQKFTYSLYTQNGIHIDFKNEGGITIKCEKDNDRYGSAWRIKFRINSDLLMSYRIESLHFTHKESFKNVLYNDQYKNYSISGATIKNKFVSAGFKNFKDLKLKKLVWKARVNSGDYLKQDMEFNAVKMNTHGKDDSVLTYKEVTLLPQTIIKAFKTNFVFKNFIKGESKEKLNKKLSNQAVKGDLTIDSVVKFLESTTVKHITTSSDNSGPWATTGTSEGIDEFNISKLQRVHPQANKFLMDNAQDIFGGLEKKTYSHGMGYYKFIKAGIRGNVFQIKRSSTTYYN